MVPNQLRERDDGAITFRRALASRNVATIKVAEQVGFDRVAALWKLVGVGTAPHAYPSIALGVFEATPTKSRKRTRCSRTKASSANCECSSR